MKDAIDAYLDAFIQTLRAQLAAKLAGVYLQGSSAQGDFRAGTSDLDLVVVVREHLTRDEKDALADALDHQRRPVPAAGLDLMIVHERAARELRQAPAYELWFATGEDWDTDVDRGGETSEAVIFLATCAVSSRALFGAAPDELFRTPPRGLVLQALTDVLEWHRTTVLDGFHDPLGQSSILNASRAWMYAETGALGSKSQGGAWALAREPGLDLVRAALCARQGGDTASASAPAIAAFLQRIIGICRRNLEPPLP